MCAPGSGTWGRESRFGPTSSRSVEDVDGVIVGWALTASKYDNFSIHQSGSMSTRWWRDVSNCIWVRPLHCFCRCWRGNNISREMLDLNKLHTNVETIDIFRTILVITSPKQPRSRLHKSNTVRPHSAHRNCAIHRRTTPIHNRSRSSLNIFLVR